jgi:hypothetical protein
MMEEIMTLLVLKKRIMITMMVEMMEEIMTLLVLKKKMM